MDAAAQHTHRDALGLHAVAFAHIGMANVDFTNQLTNEVIDIVAIGAIRQQFAIFFFHRRPVHTVHIGRIEEVTHLAPSLVVDLRPLSAQIDPFLHIAEVNTVATALRIIRTIGSHTRTHRAST